MVGSARMAPPPGAAIETSKLVELTRSEFDVTAVEFIRGGAAAAAGIAVLEPGPGLIADHIAVRFRNRSNRRRIQQFSDSFFQFALQILKIKNSIAIFLIPLSLAAR